MMILALLIGALCLYAGFQWGKGVGQTEIERKIIKHVVDSPEYGNQIVDVIRKSLGSIRDE